MSGTDRTGTVKMVNNKTEEPYGVRKLAHTAIFVAALMLVGGGGTMFYKNVVNPYNSSQENEFGVMTVTTPDPFGWVTEVATRVAATGAAVLLIILPTYFFFWFRAQRR